MSKIQFTDDELREMLRPLIREANRYADMYTNCKELGDKSGMKACGAMYDKYAGIVARIKLHLMKCDGK